MPLRILIDTFNSGLAQPTGIGTYARVLTKAHHSLGHEVFLLTDARIPFSRDANPQRPDDSSKVLSAADPVLLFDHFNGGSREPPIPPDPPPDPPWYIRNRLYSMRRLARRLDVQWDLPPAPPAPSVHLVRQLHLVHHDPIRRRLGHFDAIMNASDIFQEALGRFYKSRKPTVIELPVDVDVAHFTWCLPIRARNAKKNIYTIHDLIPLRFPYLTLEEKCSYFDLVSWCCRTADLIVTVSDHSRSEIIELLSVPPAKVVNTSQSVDPSTGKTCWPIEELKKSLDSLFGLTPAEYFLLVGAIEPRKNIARTIEAHLSASTGFPLVICGPRNPQSATELRLSDNPQLQQHWASRGKRVIIVEYLPPHLVQLLMAGARAVLVPSITEGFGLSALEAMTFGTPVIASKVGGLPEVCGPAAVYVDPYNTADLRNALETVAALPPGNLAEFRAKSIAQAKHFSFESYCARLNQLYSSFVVSPIAPHTAMPYAT